MPPKCCLGQNHKYREAWSAAEVKCRRRAEGVRLYGKAWKCPRPGAISSYISTNWSKFPGESSNGGSLEWRCEGRNSFSGVENSAQFF